MCVYICIYTPTDISQWFIYLFFLVAEADGGAPMNVYQKNRKHLVGHLLSVTFFCCCFAFQEDYSKTYHMKRLYKSPEGKSLLCSGETLDKAR